MFRKFKPKLWGLTSIGERGQVVIPAEARKNLKLEKGERLLVFSKSEDTLFLVKEKTFTGQIKKWLSQIERFQKE